ncbi:MULTISPECIES: aldo/keto reductase [unclassified Enterococcus]|uniref:aldo/keto reductase n=1 Tax=unclassified Enterococcus TaxID=2608891 RepID=UPI0015530F00|nr:MULTISPECIES: aldo/keto reductase [unclassified Enterococcus]MBS7577952.1 aldo/keto reductase [Enterococcus sp. MMGLQ5-2]MBS7585187.1 aldo/keto reductase [Enterococcus sp. MMGLQ5-1]
MAVNFKHSKLGLGTNKVGGHNLFDNLKDQDGYDLLRAGLDAGISILDTAFVYGLGRSEEIIGDVLQDYQRSDLIIATKAAQDPKHDLQLTNQPEFLIQSVNAALKRLKTDYLDIFYIHFPDKTTDKRLAVAALQELKNEGKIRAIGLSNFSLTEIKEANRDGYVDIVEDYYSLAHREAENNEWAYLKENQIDFVPYFPLESGLLTGRYGALDRAKFSRLTDESFDRAIQGIEVLREIANNHQATVTHIVLAWYMANPSISHVIPGARDAAQAKDLAKALTIQLSKADYQKIDLAFK